MTQGSLPVVVLDPGHGGTSRIGGSSPNNATGPNGLLEKDLTLDVAQRTAAALGDRARAILTRTSDVNVGLGDRAAIARRNHADVFLSIHFNGFRDPQTDGTEVWVAKSAGQPSVDLAQGILRRLVPVTGVADRGVKREDWGVLAPSRQAPETAAALAEIAFLTNPAEASRLADAAFRDRLADALAAALLERAGAAGSQPSQQPATDGHEQALRSYAAAIGGYGSPDLALDTTQLGWGVPGGRITQGFYRDRAEGRSIVGRDANEMHLGMDVSLSNAHGGGADDARRGLPVYAAIKRTIPIADLNAVRAYASGASLTGLGVDGQGDAELSHAIAFAQPWPGSSGMAYGGVVGLACRYGYTRTDGTAATLTLYLEYLHLITPSYLPKDGDGNTISAETWAATGKGSGFGPRIQNRARLSADDLCSGDPILVGYLGATQFPHTHIQAAYGSGEQGYMRSPRIDPAVMLRESATVSTTLAVPLSLRFHGRAFDVEVPGSIEPLAAPSRAAAWAAAVAMLVDWRDHSAASVRGVIERAGPEYVAALDAGRALTEGELERLLGRLGMAIEHGQDRSLDEFVELMKRYGPLWAVDVGRQGVVVTGAESNGDSTREGVWLIDPIDGTRRHESWNEFAGAYGRAAIGHA